MREFRRTLPVIFRALQDADAVTLAHLHGVRVDRKRDGSEVTVADRAAERVLRRRLGSAWPADSVFGEEYGGILTPRGRCWLIDPIDGTSTYVLGMPLYGTLLALLVDGEPVFGCIHLPALRETTYAAIGHGCWLARDGARPRRVRVAPARSLAAAQVGLTSTKDSDLCRRPGPWRLANLARRVGGLRLIGDCVQYALLCRGALDAAVDPRMKPWDIGALVPCVLEAGGSVSDLHGATTGLIGRTSLVAASSPALRRSLCRCVRPRESPQPR